MKEKENIKEETIKEVPMFNKLIVTANKENVKQTKSGIYTPFGYTDGAVKKRQTVLKVGTTVRDIKDGDEVLIDFRQYMQLRHAPGSIQDEVSKDNPVINTNYPFFELENGQQCLLIDDRDVIVKYPKKEK